MKRNRINFLLFTVCSIYILLNTSHSQSNVTVNSQRKVSIMWEIGTRGNALMFREVNSNDIIAFDDGFKIYKSSPIGYRPMFVNDKCEIYAQEKENGIIIRKKNSEEKIILPGYPEKLAASKNGDTLYYGCWTCYPDKKSENLPIQIYIVQEKKLIEGIPMHYENFWFTDKGLFYIMREEISDTVTTEVAEVIDYLFFNKNGFNKNNNILLDSTKGSFGIVSKDGNYWIGFNEEKKSVVIKTNLCNQEVPVNYNPYFFYKYKPVVVLQSVEFLLGEKNYEIMDYDIRKLCK